MKGLSFLCWLDQYIQVRESKSNIVSEETPISQVYQINDRGITSENTLPERVYDEEEPRSVFSDDNNDCEADNSSSVPSGSEANANSKTPENPLPRKRKGQNPIREND